MQRSTNYEIAEAMEGQEKRMSSPTRTSHYGDLTVDQARSVLLDQARLTALYASRVEEARAASQYGAMAHWRDEYRQSARKCRLLGERIRGERSASAVSARTGERSVVRLNPRPRTAIPQTGRAA